MTPSFFKPIALQAKRELASANLDMGSSHLHELLAALHGFNSAIAFKTFLTKQLNTCADLPVLVTLDTRRARSRCEDLNPDVSAHRVVGELSQLLRQSREPSVAYFEQDRVSDSLVSFVRARVLSEPRMLGVVDDEAARLNAKLDSGWGDNHIQRSMSLNSGPVTVGDEQVRRIGDGRLLTTTGVYTDRRGEAGSFDFEANFNERCPGIYILADSAVAFRPGEFEEDDDLVMDFQHPRED